MTDAGESETNRGMVPTKDGAELTPSPSVEPEPDLIAGGIPLADWAPTRRTLRAELPLPHRCAIIGWNRGYDHGAP